MNKNAVWAAVVAFLALFGAVFFLLGRESARRRASPATAIPVAAQDTADPAVPAAATPSAAAVPVAPLPALSLPDRPTPRPPSGMAEQPAAAVAAPPPAIAAPPLPSLGASPAVSSEAAAARDYFARMQAIQTVGPTNDTGEFANKLLTSTMAGDSSGFDDLIKVSEAGAERARAITPPQCCVEYHQRLLGMLSESVDMVRRLKTAIATNDAAALTALATAGSSLQTRATALEDEATQIKTRLGIAR